MPQRCGGAVEPPPPAPPLQPPLPAAPLPAHWPGRSAGAAAHWTKWPPAVRCVCAPVLRPPPQAAGWGGVQEGWEPGTGLGRHHRGWRPDPRKVAGLCARGGAASQRASAAARTSARSLSTMRLCSAASACMRASLTRLDSSLWALRSHSPRRSSTSSRRRASSSWPAWRAAGGGALGVDGRGLSQAPRRRVRQGRAP